RVNMRRATWLARLGCRWCSLGAARRLLQSDFYADTFHACRDPWVTPSAGGGSRRRLPAQTLSRRLASAAVPMKWVLTVGFSFCPLFGAVRPPRARAMRRCAARRRALGELICGAIQTMAHGSAPHVTQALTVVSLSQGREALKARRCSGLGGQACSWPSRLERPPDRGAFGPLFGRQVHPQRPLTWQASLACREC